MTSLSSISLIKSNVFVIMLVNYIVDDTSKINEIGKNLSKSKKPKNARFIFSSNIRVLKPIFPIFTTEKTFDLLKQTFIKVLII